MENLVNQTGWILAIILSTDSGITHSDVEQFIFSFLWMNDWCEP